MANSTLDDSKFILIDKWPGVIDTSQSVPVDGFTGTSHHNSATAAFKVGTKIQVFDETNNGYATFIYLQNVQGSAGAVAAKNPVCVDTSLAATAGNALLPTWFEVCSDGGEVLLEGPVAIALSAMTDDYYGWFWCGGVCPVSFVSGLGGNYVTDSSVAAGRKFTCADSTADGKIAFKNVAQAAASSTVIVEGCGFAMKADA